MICDKDDVKNILVRCKKKLVEKVNNGNYLLTLYADTNSAHAEFCGYSWSLVNCESQDEDLGGRYHDIKAHALRLVLD